MLTLKFIAHAQFASHFVFGFQTHNSDLSDGFLTHLRTRAEAKHGVVITAQHGPVMSLNLLSLEYVLV